MSISVRRHVCVAEAFGFKCLLMLRKRTRIRVVSLFRSIYSIPVPAAKRRLSKTQYETLAAFRYALRRFLHFSELAARKAGLTPQQHQALLAIRGFPGRNALQVGELAERLQLRHHSTVELLDRLADLDLIHRSHSTVDRRRVEVCLTARGQQLLDKLSSAHQEQLRRIGPELSALLERLAGNAPRTRRRSNSKP